MKVLLGDQTKNIPCSSTKPITGHCLGATPALEAILILYDGSALFRDRFAPPLREWSRHWARAGQATPGMHHKLEVSVWDAEGNEHRGAEEWEDP